MSLKFDGGTRRGSWVLGSVLAAALTACGGGQDPSGALDAGGSKRAASVAPPVTGVVINEINLANWKGAVDEDGSQEDWVELYNGTAAAVDLSNWGLGSKAASPFRWVFPSGTTIPAGGYLTVWLSKKDRAVPGKPLHASFNLDNGADGLLLSAVDASGATVRVDSATPPLMHPDTSWCRQPSGSPTAAFGHCQTPTPGAANSGVSYAALPAQPTLSVASGLYASAQTLTLSGAPGATLRYTLDGSEPTAASPVYNTPLVVGSSTVVRAAAFAADGARSYVETQHIVIDPAAAATYANQRVVFIAMSPADEAALQAKDKTLKSRSAVEMLGVDRTRLFKADAETDVAGQEGSLQWPQMGIDVNFRDALGFKNIKAALWPEKPTLSTTVKKFRLRNGGNDWPLAHLRDQFAQSLERLGPNLYASSSTTAVFLNGRYYGLADLREHETETLPEANLGVDRDYVDWINDPLLPAQEIKNGGAAALTRYSDAHNFIVGNDMSVAANYARARTLINVESLAHDWALHMFVVNFDWPHRNVRVWRTPAIDGRWQWSPHDLDWTFNLLGQGPDTNNNAQYDAQGSEMFRALLANAEFRALYLNANADLMNSTLTVPAMTGRLDTMVAEMRPYVAAFYARWSLGTEATWDGNLGTVRDFINRREPFHDQNLRTRFGLSARRTLTLSANDPTMGTIKVNTLDLSTLLTSAAPSWQGRYYPEATVTLEARPRPGFVFVGWQGASSATTARIQVTPSADASYTARFAAVGTVAGPTITAVPAQVHATGDMVDLAMAATDPQGYPVTWSAKTLPSGLNIDATSGKIFGRTTTPGSFATVITATNGRTASTLPISWVVRDKPGTGLVTTFWSNPDLSGTPALARDDVLGLALGGGEAPSGSSLPTSRFSVRWDGRLTPPLTGSYVFQTETSPGDGVRLYVNGQLVIDNWTAPTTVRQATVALTAGAPVSFRVEFWDAGAEATLAVRWMLPGTSAFVPLTQAVLSPPGVNAAPVMTTPPAQTSTVGTAASLAIQASDPEGGALSYSATGLPAGLSINPSTGLISGTPTTAGSQTVSVTARDAQGATTTVSFGWTVNGGGGGGGTLVNAGFETPVLAAGSFQYAPAGAGWSFFSGAGVSQAGSGFTAGLPAFTEGSQVGILQNDGVIAQTTTVTPGQVLSFSAIQRANFSTGDQTLAVFLDGVQQGATITPGRSAWTRHAVTLSPAAAGSHLIEIRGLSTGAGVDRTALVDAFQLGTGGGGGTVRVDIDNGSFETPALAAATFQYLPAGTGWTFTGNAGFTTDGSGFTLRAPVATAGRQMAFLQKQSRIGRTVTLQPGDTLLVSATQRVVSTNGPQQLAVFVNGVQQGAAFTPPTGSWATATIPLSVSVTGSYALEIRGMLGSTGDSRTAFIDLVQIERRN